MAAGPDAGAVDAAAAAVEKNAVHHHVKKVLPAIDLIVADHDLRESRTVRLDRRVAAVPIHGRGAAEDQIAAGAFEHGGADVALTGIHRDRFAGDAGLEESFGHAVRRPRLLRPGFEDQADLQRDYRQPQGVHAR
jgi:hypothetical protein